MSNSLNLKTKPLRTKRGWLRRFTRAQSGAAIVEFAFVAPLLVIMTLAIFEFMMVMFDYHRAGEATRQGVRTAAIEASVGDLDGLEAAGDVVFCTGNAGGATCTGGPVTTAASFTQVVSEMQTVLPYIGPKNVRIEYRFSGIGDATTPGGILPHVTVRLIDLARPFSLFQAIPGIPNSIGLPEFAASYLGNGNGISG